MDITLLITTFVTMFVVVDPVGLSPMFVALTQGVPAKERRAIALRACSIAFGLLILFAFFGESVLGFIGISLPAFQIAGGVLLFLTALEMLFQKRAKRREENAETETVNDPSVFPLAIPLIAGPGAIASLILITGQNEGAVNLALILGATFAVIVIVMLFFLAASLIERALGKTGIDVVTRLLGMLLAALSAQFILDGLTAYQAAL